MPGVSAAAFDETKHPRGQPDNPGKFRRRPLPTPPKATSTERARRVGVALGMVAAAHEEPMDTVELRAGGHTQEVVVTAKMLRSISLAPGPAELKNQDAWEDVVSEASLALARDLLNDLNEAEALQAAAAATAHVRGRSDPETDSLVRRILIESLKMATDCQVCGTALVTRTVFGVQRQSCPSDDHCGCGDRLCLWCSPETADW